MFKTSRSTEVSTHQERRGIVALLTLLSLALYPTMVGADALKPGEKPLAAHVRTAGSEPLAHQIPASELIGSDVKNQLDEVVGKVSDIIIVNDNGKIPFAVVSFGGIFASTGEELFAIPLSALKHNHEDGVCVLNLNMVKEAPGDKEKKEWLEVSEDENDVQTDESPLGEYWVEPPSTNAADAKPGHQSKALSAVAILGAEIKNKNGEAVGELDELIVDLDEGFIVNTVFVAGGVLGVGAEHYLLPWKSLTHSREEGTLIANVDQKMLESMPRYEGEEEPASPPPAPGS